MNNLFNAVEIRVLGSLIEKQLTTPEYYPLTLNALTNACNQKNNRDPIVSFEETTVVRGLDGLREKKLISTVTGTGIRVPKYKHSFTETFNVSPQEVTVLCLLLLRGPQTIGELRGRAGSMYNFSDLTEVETTLEQLCSKEGREPLVRKIPRLPGQKEVRFTHLFSGEPDINEHQIAPSPEPATMLVRAENERISKLEEEMKNMLDDIKKLKQTFLDFKKQFE